MKWTNQQSSSLLPSTIRVVTKFVKQSEKGWKIQCNQGGEQQGRLHVNWQTKIKFRKNWIFGFSLPVSSQLILKYAYALDILIPHNVHMTYFDYTLPILQNFEKTKCANGTSFKFSAFKLFSQSFGELTRCSQNMSCGQCEVSKCLAYRHILKSIVRKLEEKHQRFSFFGTWINFNQVCSSHAICSAAHRWQLASDLINKATPWATKKSFLSSRIKFSDCYSGYIYSSWRNVTCWDRFSLLPNTNNPPLRSKMWLQVWH